jgi:hypothetical protein
MTRWIETDSLSNQNISSALAIGAYTADADRLIICDVSVDQVAGTGDYVMYVTRQIGGAGSSYVLLPKTTMTAAAGETAISGQSGLMTVRSGDVLTVYVDGLAGDTTTPDTAVRWFESALGTDEVSAGALSAGAVDEILDEIIEGTTTLRQLLRGFAAVMLGKSANGGADFRDLADSKTRVDSTLDANGNRTAVTLDLT